MTLDQLSKSGTLPDTVDVFSGGGEMGALMRAFDWATTPLGPVAGWPPSLRTLVGVCLNSRFPMLIWWGPELIKLYNDAYRPILGATKHPGALGQRGRDCWPEIWDTIGPMLEDVLTTGVATWSNDQLLLLDRNGYREECYFTFSYSPIRDETGAVSGVFTAVTETTRRVLGERRLATLRDLADRAAEARSVEEACQVAARTLEANPLDLPFALIYLIDDAGSMAHLAGAVGLEQGGLASPHRVDLSDAAPTSIWPLARVALTDQPVTVIDLDAYAGDLSGRPWPDAPNTALVLPIAASGHERLAGLLVAGISPRRALDADYQSFLDLVAAQIATAIASASAYTAERKRAEALAELNRAKTTFFSNISHEFRTPLTLLLGPIADLLDDPSALALAARNRLTIVQRNALRLLKLVNTLLDFARIEAGRIDAVYEPTNLADLTANLASVFRAAAERGGLRLVVACPPLAEPVYVDREMWEKIVLNLLSNAFKFTFAGEITVALHQTADHAILTVSDTGVGIAPEDLPHIFERFRQGRRRRARTHEGSGIGLALVRELVHLHSGSVAVSSSVGVGSRFVVTIPCGVAHLPADRIETSRPAGDNRMATDAFVAEALRWLPAPDPLDYAVKADGAETPAPHPPARRRWCCWPTITPICATTWPVC